MAIKSVSCPQCRTSVNVPASMASTKCPACGAVFSVSGAASPAASSASPKRVPADEDSGGPSGERLGQWLIVGGVALLAVIGLVVLTMTSFGKTVDGETADADAPMRDQATVVEALELNEDEVPEYRVVDLPESTRKAIYRDYSKMIASSFGKAKKIPKGGAIGQALNQTLGQTVDREVTSMAIIHGITEEDIAQIYAEGQAKGW